MNWMDTSLTSALNCCAESGVGCAPNGGPPEKGRLSLRQKMDVVLRLPHGASMCVSLALDSED